MTQPQQQQQQKPSSQTDVDQQVQQEGDALRPRFCNVEENPVESKGD